MLAHYGRNGIEPGDLLLTNDAYIHGSHLSHMVFALPVFWEGELVGFAASMAHWQDVGGTLSGVTTDIYSEGLQLPKPGGGTASSSPSSAKMCASPMPR